MDSCRRELGGPQYAGVDDRLMRQVYRKRLIIACKNPYIYPFYAFTTDIYATGCRAQTSEMVSQTWRDITRWTGLMAFHASKMSDINRVVRELYSERTGQDIDYIQIRSDDDGAAKNRWSPKLVQLPRGQSPATPSLR